MDIIIIIITVEKDQNGEKRDFTENSKVKYTFLGRSIEAEVEIVATE
jgi:hypothetical protein